MIFLFTYLHINFGEYNLQLWIINSSLGILTLLAQSTILLVTFWLLFLLLDSVWSGFANFIRIILFPGVILHAVSHILFSKIFRIPSSSGFILSLYREYTFVYIKESNLLQGILIALAPIFLVIPMYLLLSYFLLHISNSILVIIISWFCVSLIITGMPSKADIIFLIVNILHKKPLAILLYFWSFIVFITGYLALGIDLSIIITFGYFFGINLALGLIFRTKKEAIIVIDDEVNA